MYLFNKPNNSEFFIQMQFFGDYNSHQTKVIVFIVNIHQILITTFHDLMKLYEVQLGKRLCKSCTHIRVHIRAPVMKCQMLAPQVTMKLRNVAGTEPDIIKEFQPDPNPASCDRPPMESDMYTAMCPQFAEQDYVFNPANGVFACW